MHTLRLKKVQKKLLKFSSSICLKLENIKKVDDSSTFFHIVRLENLSFY